MLDINIRSGRKDDVQAIHELIMELAIFEKAEHEVETTKEDLLRDGFCENPLYKVLIAEENNKIIGLALFYSKYSTWKGRCIYLEDLIVSKEHRGKGVGKLLFNSVAKEAKEIGAGRMEWQVLDWNETGINFYKKNNAILDNTWINCKLNNTQLEKF